MIFRNAWCQFEQNYENIQKLINMVTVAFATFQDISFR